MPLFSYSHSNLPFCIFFVGISLLMTLTDLIDDLWEAKDAKGEREGRLFPVLGICIQQNKNRKQIVHLWSDALFSHSLNEDRTLRQKGPDCKSQFKHVSRKKVQIKLKLSLFMEWCDLFLEYFWLKFWNYEQALFILNNSASLRLLSCPCAANRRAFSSLWRRARSQRVSEGSWGPGFTFGGGGFVGALVGGGTGSGCFGGLNSCEF